MGITGRAAERIGVEPPAWTAEQLATGEERLLDRDAAIKVAELLDLSDWLNAISSEANLEDTVDHPAWGKLSGRSLLHFAAVHEANHVEQLEELRTANS
ncbi:MAG: DinB family protein [Thermomicrobiales bacterium]